MVDIRIHGTKRDIKAKIKMLERFDGLEVMNPTDLRPDSKCPGKYFLYAVLAAPEEKRHRPRSRSLR